MSMIGAIREWALIHILKHKCPRARYTMWDPKGGMEMPPRSGKSSYMTETIFDELRKGNHHLMVADLKKASDWDRWMGTWPKPGAVTVEMPAEIQRLEGEVQRMRLDLEQLASVYEKHEKENRSSTDPNIRRIGIEHGGMAHSIRMILRGW